MLVGKILLAAMWTLGWRGLKVRHRDYSRILFQIANRNDVDLVSGRQVAVEPRYSQEGAQFYKLYEATARY